MNDYLPAISYSCYILIICLIGLLGYLLDLLRRKNNKIRLSEKQLTFYLDKWNTSKDKINSHKLKITGLYRRLWVLEKELKSFSAEKENADSLLLVEENNIQKTNESDRLKMNRMKDRPLMKSGSCQFYQSIIMRLKKRPTILEENDWEELQITLDAICDSFTKRLKALHPKLTNDDIKYCILFKLSFKISEIAIMMNVQSTTVSKRKQRIKEHLREGLSISIDFDSYIKSF